MDNEKKKITLQCYQCLKYFESESSLNHHYERNTIVCKFCKSDFDSKEKLILHHIKRHSKLQSKAKGDVGRFKCPNEKYCPEVSTNTTILYHHIISKHGFDINLTDSPVFECCNDKYQSLEELNQHTRYTCEKYFKSSNGFKCTFCSRRYNSMEELTQHYHDSPDHPRHGLLNRWTDIFILLRPAWGLAFNPNNVAQTHSIFVKL